MKSSMYIRVVCLKEKKCTNWCGSPNDALESILLNDTRIQNGDCYGDAIRITSSYHHR